MLTEKDTKIRMIETNKNMYEEDFKLYNQIREIYTNLQEVDYASAFKLQKAALNLYDRFSYIYWEIRSSERGRKKDPAFKDRISDMMGYLSKVHVSSRMVWAKSKNDLSNLMYS